ncbi:hypothetical protein LTR85_005168 [Meristemomyces frigidus]|nr:hypothetical protein LTR85_005168 [Meristemomyces frigidus]
MAQLAKPLDKLLQRPLYIFDLPEELLYTLQLKTQTLSAREAPEKSSARTSTPGSPSPNGSDGAGEGHKAATSCTLCGLNFTDLQEQRSHVRSDLHGYNLKQKLRGKQTVGETEFERLVGDLDESLSGSDSSDSDDDDGDQLDGSKMKDTTLSALLRRQAKVTDGDAEDAPARKRKQGQGNPPVLWFASSKLPSNTSLGVYRAIFSNKEQLDEEHLVETIQRKQLAPKPAPPQQKKPPRVEEEDGGVPLPASMLPQHTSASGPHYFLCMIGGGHFAGMLVSLIPKLTKKAGLEDRSATVIAHKTFHRYTTRRKQGGSQSANDNSKGNAHSAGAGIRRYNETALIDEVRALLAEWRGWIDSAELVFVRASGSTNRRTLFGPYEDQVLSHKDERLRGFPFNTRRATQSELMRAFVELTRVKVETVDEAALARQAEEAAATSAKAEAALANSKTTAPKSVKPSKAEEEAALHTTQLQALIRRSKAPGLLSYFHSNGVSPDFRFFPPDQNHHAPTPLHLAAASNSPACVSALLVKAGADPTVRNDDGKSAFDIAGDRPTRDAFRLARSQLGEDRYSWDTAGVPPALSQAEADKRTAREKEEKAVEDAAEKQRRAAETERLREEDAEKQAGARDKKFGKGHVIEKPKFTAEERRMEEARGMTDDMRMRLEREKRARAAEERMKRLQGK